MCVDVSLAGEVEKLFYAAINICVKQLRVKVPLKFSVGLAGAVVY